MTWCCTAVYCVLCTVCWCSRAVGSRQSSPTDIETQPPSSSRLTDSALLSQQHPVQNAHPVQNSAAAAAAAAAAATAGGQFDGAGLTCPSSASPVVSGLTDSFFTGQYMMDTPAFTAAQQPDYNQQVISCNHSSYQLLLSF